MLDDAVGERMDLLPFTHLLIILLEDPLGVLEEVEHLLCVLCLTTPDEGRWLLLGLEQRHFLLVTGPFFECSQALGQSCVVTS